MSHSFTDYCLDDALDRFDTASQWLNWNRWSTYFTTIQPIVRPVTKPVHWHDRFMSWLGLSESSLNKISQAFNEYIQNKGDNYVGSEQFLRTVEWLNSKIEKHNNNLCFLFKPFLTVEKITYELIVSRILKSVRENCGTATLLERCTQAVITHFERVKKDLHTLPFDLQDRVAHVIQTNAYDMPRWYFLKFLPGITTLRLPCVNNITSNDVENILQTFPHLQHLILPPHIVDLSNIDLNLNLPQLEILKAPGLTMHKKSALAISRAAPNLRTLHIGDINEIGKCRFPQLNKLELFDNKDITSSWKLKVIAECALKLRTLKLDTQVFCKCFFPTNVESRAFFSFANLKILVLEDFHPSYFYQYNSASVDVIIREISEKPCFPILEEVWVSTELGIFAMYNTTTKHNRDTSVRKSLSDWEQL